MTLLLGPPGAGKTTLLLALAGKLDDDLRVRIQFSLVLACLLFTISIVTYLEMVNRYLGTSVTVVMD